MTPQERFLCFQRRSTTGKAIPTWLATPGPVLLRRFVRQSKSEPLVDEVELVEANPHYAHIKFPNGQEDTVSIRDLAPIGQELSGEPQTDHVPTVEVPPTDEPTSDQEEQLASPVLPQTPAPGLAQPPLRRSEREHRPPVRYGFKD